MRSTSAALCLAHFAGAHVAGQHEGQLPVLEVWRSILPFAKFCVLRPWTSRSAFHGRALLDTALLLLGSCSISRSLLRWWPNAATNCSSAILRCLKEVQQLC